jgi:hypothetical protein
VIVYLIGGGPSAADLNTNMLRGGLRIGVNDAAFHLPCDAFFSNDHGYCLGIRDKIEAFPGERHLAVRRRFFERFSNWDATIWQRMDEANPCTTSLQLSSGPHGTPGCSGYVAMNLAAQKGATTIVLFGYDFQAEYRYFFSSDPYPRVEIPGVIESFRKVAPWYRERGITVLNANPASAIDAFPRITHQEAFDHAHSRCDIHEPAGSRSKFSALA